jgi:hypothetical protein
MSAAEWPKTTNFVESPTLTEHLAACQPIAERFRRTENVQHREFSERVGDQVSPS